MVVPGEWLLSAEPIEINAGRRTLRVSVRNTGDRPIQVGSHFHFFEVNRALEFDRPSTLGMRLDVPSGTSIRFEAGDERDVELVEFGGLGRVIGFNALLDGGTSSQRSVERAIRRAAELGFLGTQDRPRAGGQVKRS
ncbi:urease subunit beta [Pseudonocardia sp. CA-142604]|uniref:urease subunit beta n=1 Tax=Pseudonocardia sp. CA-142604 TaxID=3240024 RepID=UPI003D90C7F0